MTILPLDVVNIIGKVVMYFFLGAAMVGWTSIIYDWLRRY